MKTLGSLAEELGATLAGSARPESLISRVAAHGDAGLEALIFIENAASVEAVRGCGAGGVLAPVETEAGDLPLLRVKQPRLAFARAARLLRVEGLGIPGVHASAVIAANARLGAGVDVGALACIGRAVVGARTSIGAGCVIADGVVIGCGCRIYPNVTIYAGTTLRDGVIVHAGAVLGADGFGYVRDRETGAYLQFPQQGTLVIEADVEIGANTTIDRGALKETRVGQGSKLDNLVHVGHNVRIGKNVVIAAQTGISGSSVIGDGALIGGQVGIADHVSIGEGVILGAQAGIPSQKRISGAGVVFWGTPARPIKQYLKDLAMLARLSRREEGR